jgi:hypothetical protein
MTKRKPRGRWVPCTEQVFDDSNVRGRRILVTTCIFERGKTQGTTKQTARHYQWRRGARRAV